MSIFGHARIKIYLRLLGLHPVRPLDAAIFFAAHARIFASRKDCQ